MAEYIERNEFLELQIKRCSNFPPLTGTCAMDNVTLESEIMKFPVADVEPVRRGHWIKESEHILLVDGTYKEWDNFYCSECDAPENAPRKFCAECGAKMEEYKSDIT